MSSKTLRWFGDDDLPAPLFSATRLVLGRSHYVPSH